MNRRIGFLSCLFILTTLPSLICAGNIPGPGDRFPNLEFANLLSAAELKYLGIEKTLFGLLRKKQFTLADIAGQFILVEYFNRYCSACQLQAPVLDAFYRLESKKPAGIRLIAIASGNNPREVEAFKREKKVAYPILSDPQFKAYDALGKPSGTPLFFILKKTGGGLLVQDAHLGLEKNLSELQKRIRTAMAMSERDLAKRRNAAGAPAPPGPVFTGRLELLAKERLLRLLGDGASFKVHNSLTVGRIYIGKKLNRVIFARGAEKNQVCDVCDPVAFVYIFDAQGRVLDFVPLKLTKKDNLPWSAADIEKTKNRLIDKLLGRPFDFNAPVDSVTGATISSSLIFHSLDQDRNLLKVMKKEGLL